jgi:hypothetical protein
MASVLRQFETSRASPFFLDGEKGFLEKKMTPFLDQSKTPFLIGSKIVLLEHIKSESEEVVALQHLLKSFPKAYAQGIDLINEIGGRMAVIKLQTHTLHSITHERTISEISQMESRYDEMGPKLLTYRRYISRVIEEIKTTIESFYDVEHTDTRVLEIDELETTDHAEKVYDFCQRHLEELYNWRNCGEAMRNMVVSLIHKEEQPDTSCMQKFRSAVESSHSLLSQLGPRSLFGQLVYTPVEVKRGRERENLDEMFDQMHLEQSSTTDVKAASMKPEEIKAYLKEVCILIKTTAKKFSLEINFKEILELCEFNEKELIRSSDPQLHGRLLDYIEQLKNDNLILLSPSEKPVKLLKGIQNKLIMFLAKKIKQYLGKNEKVFFRKITAGEELRFHELLQQISPTYSPNEKKINNPASSNLQKLIDNNFSSYSKPKKDPHKIFLFEKLIALEALCQELTAK